MDITMNTVYMLNGQEMQLKDIIPIINPGDSIKGINNFIIANLVLSKINLHTKSNHTYLFDGPDKIILF